VLIQAQKKPINIALIHKKHSKYNSTSTWRSNKGEQGALKGRKSSTMGSGFLRKATWLFLCVIFDLNSFVMIITIMSS
jgi:hypothetical protein